jgi:cytochrome c oxidase subunit II
VRWGACGSLYAKGFSVVWALDPGAGSAEGFCLRQNGVDLSSFLCIGLYAGLTKRATAWLCKVSVEGAERVGHAMSGPQAAQSSRTGGGPLAAKVSAIAAGAFCALAAAPAWAAEPTPGSIDLQPAATQVMEDVREFHVFMLYVMVGISAIVLALLLWVIVRYNRRANPTPKSFTHNMAVEVVWTVVPVLILVLIAFQSFPLLFEEERPFGGHEYTEEEVITIKAIGNSWNWTYRYQDNGDFEFTSSMLPEDEAAAAGLPRLLATDNAMVVPVGVPVELLVTSSDVIHSWAMPSFGVKEDAVPGRVNAGWFIVREPGTYYGQCSELCGLNHAYMPIEVRAVSLQEYNAWVVQQGGTVETAEATAAAPAG